MKTNYKGHELRYDIGTFTIRQYQYLIDLLEIYKPKNIFELGSGESTKIFDSYCKNNDANCSSVENDINYVNYNLHNIHYLILGLNNRFQYDDLNQYISNNIDLLVIDGPNDILPTNQLGLSHSRIQLLEFVPHLKKNSIIMFHDSEYEESQNTLNEFEHLLNTNNIIFSKEVIKETDYETIIYYERTLNSCPELTVYYLQ